MPRLKRDIFLRDNAMTQRFGSATDDDPMRSASESSFDWKIPVSIKATSSSGAKGKLGGASKNGLSRFQPALSPVDKFRGGRASLSGPKPDYADEIANRIPMSTKARKVTAGAK